MSKTKPKMGDWAKSVKGLIFARNLQFYLAGKKKFDRHLITLQIFFVENFVCDVRILSWQICSLWCLLYTIKMKLLGIYAIVPHKCFYEFVSKPVFRTKESHIQSHCKGSHMRVAWLDLFSDI